MSVSVRVYTFFVGLLQRGGDPLHGFSRHLGTKVPVEGGRSTPLWPHSC